MSKTLRKEQLTTLHQDSYRQLHRQVLKRDGWRCQACGSMHNLQVHHLQLRSHSGSDHEENLITYCVRCLLQVHGRSRRTDWRPRGM